jgi:hypothetical protein
MEPEKFPYSGSWENPAIVPLQNSIMLVTSRAIAGFTPGVIKSAGQEELFS